MKLINAEDVMKRINEKMQTWDAYSSDSYRRGLTECLEIIESAKSVPVGLDHIAKQNKTEKGDTHE